jgi:arsenate reductase (thioredoxin)
MSVNPHPDLERRMQREIARLSDEFRGVFSPETIDRCARESLDRLAGARVTAYLPTFTYRFTRERLKALAGVEGLIRPGRPELLFICERNAARSQMAAALARHHSEGWVEVHSAGSRPADQLNPAAVAVMAELGVDLSQEYPKPLSDEVVRAADVVITMGCGDACPVYPFKEYHDWQIADPEGQSIEEVRRIRDEIGRHVERLLAELGGMSRC